jgi:ankyrin repeat protein
MLHIKDGDTALTKAARYGFNNIVKLLLAREDIQVNLQNKV